MRRNTLLFIFLLIFASCHNNNKADNSLAKTITDVTKKEFQKRSIEFNNVIIDSIKIETINLKDFYIDRIHNFRLYLADEETANQTYIKDLLNKGDTGMANKVQVRHLKNVKIASLLDSLHNKADSSIKIFRAAYLLTAKIPGLVLNEEITKYFYKKDTTEVVIQTADPTMDDIVNGNNYLMLLSIGRTIKEGN